MREEYKMVMNETMLEIRSMPLICFTLDGATNIQSKQVINMMACGPKAFFLEHFTMELRRESAANLLESLLSSKLHLLSCLREPRPGFVLARAGGDDAAEIEDEGRVRVASKNEHFLKPPMFCFCSDSPSVMVKLRRDCLENAEFMFAFGCAPHALHNFVKDLLKSFPGIKKVLKRMMFMVKSLKSSHLLLALFDKLCLEKLKKILTLILYTKSRWGTAYYMAVRINQVSVSQLPPTSLTPHYPHVHYR